MAEMGLGYGSEYQLLRFLGHHRNELNESIRANTRLIGELIWLDFPKDLNRLSLDGEYVGLNFLKDKMLKGIITKYDLEDLLSSWKEYWSAIGGQPNLDGIILHKNGNELELVIVEAKAHLKEIESKTASESNQKIQNAFQQTQNYFEISNNNWFGKYYQLANRLSLVNFLENNKIKKINSSLLYVFFLNGYEKRQLKGRVKITVKNKGIEKKEDWEKVIKDEYVELGISDKAKKHISNVFTAIRKSEIKSA
jgi:hypothetical protein